MKTVMVFGTFDILHHGHINFLRQAGKLGDYLIAVVARDKTALEVKKILPRHNEKDRLKSVKASGAVDKAVLGRAGDKYAIIKKYKPDVVALGYDQKFFTQGLRKKLNEYKLEEAKIVRLKAYKPHKYKSSKLFKKRAHK